MVFTKDHPVFQRYILFIIRRKSLIYQGSKSFHSLVVISVFKKKIIFLDRSDLPHHSLVNKNLQAHLQITIWQPYEMFYYFYFNNY